MANYWKDKSERAEKAKQWADYVVSNYGPEVEYSISNSIEYDGVNPDLTDFTKDYKIDIYRCASRYLPNSNNFISIVPLDTISAVYMLDHYNCIHNRLADRIAILNFASFTHPGGMFLAGSSAQEESICHETTLFPVLAGCPDFYKRNKAAQKQTKCGTLYTNRLLYTPHIIVEREGFKKTVDVITCAAPNLREISISSENEYALLYNRAILIIDTAYKNGVKELVLGAWGCGVFRCDPYIVAKAFYDAIKYLKHDMVYIFAIPADIDNKNYTAFDQFLMSLM